MWTCWCEMPRRPRLGRRGRGASRRRKPMETRLSAGQAPGRRRITIPLQPLAAPATRETRRVGTGRDALLMVFATVVVALLNYALNIILGWSLTADEYGR